MPSRSTNDGIDHDDQIPRIASDRHVDDEDAQRHADLRRRKPDPGRRIHRLDHVVDEPPDVIVHDRNRGSGFVERVLAVSQNRPNHQWAEAKLAVRDSRALLRVNCSRNVVVQALIERSSSATESPPNFSMSASARTSATMASPTTAAAGTAQTSLRSIAADASPIVVRSTERSGFISVEIGFIHAETRRSSPLVTPPSRPPALLRRTRHAGDAVPARRRQNLVVDPRSRARRRFGTETDADGLDRGDRHQRLGQAAVQLPVPLHVAAEADGHAGGDHFERAALACRRLRARDRSLRSSGARRLRRRSEAAHREPAPRPART